MIILALDIGGTAIKSALVTSDGVRTQRRETKSEGNKGGAVLMNNAIALTGSYSDFDRIAISVTGQVHPEDGSILFANDNVPHFTGTRVRDIFEQRFGVPVTVMNDVNAAALGEAYFGAATEEHDFVCLTYGTGVGGAIVMNRQIYTGSTGSAGEFGHLITHPNGIPCVCGQQGCYEQYASTSALLRKGAERGADYSESRGIFRLRNSGDPIAQDLVEAWIHEVALGLVSICHIFNPSCLVLGGGILQEPNLINEINSHLLPMLIPSFRNVILRAACLGNDAGLMGAAMQSLLTHPAE